MDEAVHALATAALADGVKRLARSCRTIESVELTVTLPQGGSVAVAAHGIALCSSAPQSAGRGGHRQGSTRPTRGQRGQRRERHGHLHREAREQAAVVETAHRTMRVVSASLVSAEPIV